jgi:hypothetical protein
LKRGETLTDSGGLSVPGGDVGFEGSGGTTTESSADGAA